VPRSPVSFRLELQEAPPSPFGDADELAASYGFLPAFPLREELDLAAGKYRTIDRARLPTAQERRRRLDLLENEARAVLGGDLRRALPLARLLAAGGRGGLPFADGSVEARLEIAEELGTPVRFDVAELKDLLEQVARARVPLARARPPIPGDRALRWLVVDLGRIWREGTGRPPGRGRDGPFPRFLEEMARRAGVRASREALVKLHFRWGE